MTRPPTKADLEAAVERLTQEKAGLLELIKAISETAALPIEAVDGDRGYYRAHRAMAITIGQVCGMAADGTLGSPAWGAQYIRGVRAEQEAKYGHCDAPAAVAPEGLEDAAAQDENEADDPFMQPAPMQDPAPVVRVLDGPASDRLEAALAAGTACAEIHPGGNYYMCELLKGHDGDHDVPSCDDGSGRMSWPAAAPVGLEDAAAQDDDDTDDGGCVAVSPAGSDCIRADRHDDGVDGMAHRDVSGRRWDDYGWVAAPGGMQDPAPVVRVLDGARAEAGQAAAIGGTTPVPSGINADATGGEW